MVNTDYKRMFQQRFCPIENDIHVVILQPVCTSPLFDPDIQLRTAFSDTLNICSSETAGQNYGFVYLTILAMLCVCIVSDIYRGKGRASVFMNNYPGGKLGFLRRNGQGEKMLLNKE